MEAFFKELREQLEEALGQMDSEESPVRGYDEKAGLVEEAIREIKAFLAKHPFKDKPTEIMYFKHWAPHFFQLHIFYSLLYNLELTRITATSRGEWMEYLKKNRKRISKFLKKHTDLRIYQHFGQTDMDETLFVSTTPTKEERFLISDAFYCKNSLCLAKIRAYEDYLIILATELNEARKKAHAGGVDRGPSVVSGRKYLWKPTKAQTAEIVYSFVKLKCMQVEGHDADIKDIVTFFKDVFGYDINSIYDVEYNNKKRKKEKAPYLTALIEAYLSPDE